MSICAMCGGSTASPNYAKTVDPPNQPYGSILGDAPQGNRRGGQGNACIPIQMCIPQLSSPQPPCGGGGAPKSLNAIVNVPRDSCKPCPQIFCEPCPPPPPTKVWLIKSSPMPQKSFCLPVGGSCGRDSSSPKTMMVCLPCAPAQEEPQKRKKKELTPIGVISRCKDFDLIGGKLIGGCSCGMRNGLNGEGCRRVSCQNNPGCTMVPPRCWPQIPDPEPTPPPPPKQDLICLPIELVFYDPDSKK